MPYRIDLVDPPPRAADTLIDLGALDVEPAGNGLAALMPDSVLATDIATALQVRQVRVSRAVGRDDDSIWTLSRRPVRIGSLLIASGAGERGALTIADSAAFGTGLHATTVLCVEALQDLIPADRPGEMLDVGTGTGILALAALWQGVERATGIDTDPRALQAAAENARLNAVATRLLLVRGGPDSLQGSWPLVIANIRAAELIDMAPALVRRVRSGGALVLSGIPVSVADEVGRAYRRLGMRPVGRADRDGWCALRLRPSW